MGVRQVVESKSAWKSYALSMDVHPEALQLRDPAHSRYSECSG